MLKMQAINVKYIFNLSYVKYSVFSFFPRDVEDWFAYGKFNVFRHISASCVTFNIEYK